MKSLLSSLRVNGVIVIFSILVTATAAHAQDNLDFDPSHLPGATNGGSTGGSGSTYSFNTSSFYNETTTIDQLYSSGDYANFYNGTGGVITLDVPTTIATATAQGQLVTNTSGGVYTFGAPAATNALIFDNPGSRGLININPYGGTSNVVFNAPIDIVYLPDTNAPGDGVPAGDALVYNDYISNNGPGNVTINNVNYSGPVDAATNGTVVGNYGGGSYTLNGAITNTTGNTSTPDPAFGINYGTATLTSNFSLSHVGLGANQATIYAQSDNLGADTIGLSGASFLTDAAGLTITNSINASYSSIGTATTDDATYSGTINLYGTNTGAPDYTPILYPVNFQAKPGSEIHITTGGIYAAGTNVITINDPTLVTAANAGDVADPGVVSLEGPLFSNGNAEIGTSPTNFNYVSSTSATINVANGTFLVNYGTLSNPVIASTINISSATPGSPAVPPSSGNPSGTPAVPPTYTGTLGGTGVIGGFDYRSLTYLSTVVTAGPLSTISPGNVTKVAATTPGGTPTFASQVGTLTLAGGLDMTNGATLKFDLNGANTNAYDTLNFAGSSVTATADSVITFDFTNLGGALTTGGTADNFVPGAAYTIFTGVGFNTYSDDGGNNFVFNAPAGYEVVNYNFGSDPSGAGEFQVEFEATAVPEPSTWAMLFGGLGLLVLVSRLRHRQSA